MQDGAWRNDRTHRSLTLDITLLRGHYVIQSAVTAHNNEPRFGGILSGQGDSVKDGDVPRPVSDASRKTLGNERPARMGSYHPACLTDATRAICHGMAG
jgi:hypothetical protein